MTAVPKTNKIGHEDPPSDDEPRSPIPLFHANVFKANGLLGTL